jgi:hypothetical protein
MGFFGILVFDEVRPSTPSGIYVAYGKACLMIITSVIVGILQLSMYVGYCSTFAYAKSSPCYICRPQKREC